MPRLQDTRQYKAEELKRTLELGPAFLPTERPIIGSPGDYRLEFTPEDAARQYQRWLKPWVLPTVVQLIPELTKRRTR